MTKCFFAIVTASVVFLLMACSSPPNNQLSQMDKTNSKINCSSSNLIALGYRTAADDISKGDGPEYIYECMGTQQFDTAAYAKGYKTAMKELCTYQLGQNFKLQSKAINLSPCAEVKAFMNGYNAPKP